MTYNNNNNNKILYYADFIHGVAAYIGKVIVVVVVVVIPQRVCPSKPAPLRKSKQLAGECHWSSGLLMLCCVLMCVNAGQWGIMCVRQWVPVLQYVQTSSTESPIRFR